MTSRIHVVPSPSQQQTLAYDPLLDDVGYMTCMTLVLLGNYAQTGHFGGPLAYTPYNVAAHLAGPENGGLRYDYRRPEASLLRQIHAGGGPLDPHLLRAVDDHGPGAVSQVSADRRSALSRRPARRDAADRRVGIPARRGRAEDAAARNGFGRPSAVRASQRPRHSCARGTCRKHRLSPTT